MCSECYGIYSNCPICGVEYDEEETNEYLDEDEDIERYYEEKYEK